MRKTEIIDKQFKELIAQGETVLGGRRPPPRNVIGDHRVDSGASQVWATSSMAFLGRVFGMDSDYYLEFKKKFKLPGYESEMTLALAVLQAAWNDYSSGYLARVNSLVTAEVFDDLLEQAEYLFLQGYHQPAAVVAGAVLEDTLRKMCSLNGIVFSAKPKLDVMNADLTKKGTYTVLVQKKVTWLADIRNKAAHGQWNDFAPTDVEKMLRDVRDFVTDYVV